MRVLVSCDHADPAIKPTMDGFANQKGGTPNEDASTDEVLAYDFDTSDSARMFGAFIAVAGVVSGVAFT